MITELAIGLLMTCSAAPAAGGVDSLVSAGDRLRITSHNRTDMVIVEEVTDRQLIYRSEKNMVSGQLPWSEISRIEREIPNSRIKGMTRGMGAGFGVGFIAGFILGAIAGTTDDGCPGDGTEICIDIHPLAGGILGGLAFGAAGMLVGGPVGAIYPGHGWETIEPKISTSLTVDRDNTLMFKVSVPF